jgi:hypothetical protein
MSVSFKFLQQVSEIINLKRQEVFWLMISEVSFHDWSLLKQHTMVWSGWFGSSHPLTRKEKRARKEKTESYSPPQ